jgi:hypothetical protein
MILENVKIKKMKCSRCGQYNEWIDSIQQLHLKPETCKFCGIKYWEKPENEIKLFLLQDEYLKSRESDTLGKMSVIIYDISKNIIIKKLKNSRKIQIEDIEDKTSDTVEKIISYYISKPNFSIDNSFTGYIEQVVLYPLYNKKVKEKERNEISMEAILENVNNNNNSNNNISSETLDLKYNLSGSNISSDENDHGSSKSFSINNLFKYSSDEYIINYANIDFFVNDICKAIEALLNLVLKNYGLKEALIQSLFFYHFFGKANKNFYNKLSDMFGDESSSRFKYIVDCFLPSFREFEKKLLILRNALYKDFS